MLKTLMLGLALATLIASCSSSLKLNNQYNNYTAAAMQSSAKAHGPNAGSEMKEVTISPRNSNSYTRQDRVAETLRPKSIDELNAEKLSLSRQRMSEPNSLQIKYAGLLNVVPNLLLNTKLLESIDDWYGTRYLYGGTTKRGVDCSAFVRAVYKSAFGLELPRTARQQYSTVRRISTTELKEGDLVFFNTTGGVSHVGVYLRNNKFVHASSGRGVIVSDLYETYYISRFLGGGRMEGGYLAANSEQSSAL